MHPTDRDKRDFRLGEWLVQPSLGRITGPSGEVQLEPRMMELLVYLADNALEVISRRQILDEVWRQEFVSDAAASGTIAKLRKALGDDARNPRYVETLSKRGYRLLIQPIDVLEVASRPGGSFRVGEWLVEPSLNRMTRNGETVELDRSTMDVLLFLAERAGEPVSRHEIVERVWSTESVSDFTVGRRIAELEEALGSGARNPSYIEAVPDGGFRLAAAVGFSGPEATIAPFPAAHAEPDRDPYPGLAAFTADDSGVFFGREIEVAALWRKISGHRLLAVIGPSGVGKSSFIRAGFIPAAPRGWRSLICTPGEAPFRSLARAMVPELAGDTGEIEQLLSFDDPEVAFAVLSRWRERWDEGLLVVDQLEELFTLNPPEIRARFVDLLTRLATTARCRVVIVMRDDFFAELHAYPGLAPVYRDLTVLGPPGAGDLRRALVEPARQRGFSFDDQELPDEMVASLADERGALPLLAFAARRLWELRDTGQRLITREAYDSVGGVAGALAHHAEATLEEIGPARLPIVRELFRNLVTARATRATRSVDDLLSVFTQDDRGGAGEVLQKLVDARLLTSFEEASGDELESVESRRVEIVHESLLREWPRLVGWQTQDADAARLRDQLRQAAQLWEVRGRPTELLWTGAPYREYRVWREAYPGGLSSVEDDFANAMVGHTKRRRRRRRVAVGAVLLVALGVAAVTTALWRRSERHARRLESGRLAQIAERRIESSPATALAYALASLGIMDGPRARRLALQAVHGSPMPIVIGRDRMPSLAVGVDFSPDGRWLSTGHFYGSVCLWPDSGGEPVVWKAQKGNSRGYFAPDSKVLLSMSNAEEQLSLWSVPDHRRLGALRDAVPARRDMDVRNANIWCAMRRFVRDSSMPGGWNGDFRPLDLVDSLTGDRIPSAALGPGGSGLVVALGEDLLHYSVDEPRSGPLRLARVESEVQYAAYHPDGVRLATAHTNGELVLWKIGNGTAEPLRVWRHAVDNACNQLLFDPSGELLAVAFDSAATALRSIDDPPGADPLLLHGVNIVAELAFSPDGKWLAVADFDSVRLWPARRTRYPMVLRGHTARVERVAFTPDGRELFSYSNDGTVRQWALSAADGSTTRVLHDWGHAVESTVGWMTVAPNGRFVVATGSEDTALVIPLEGGAPRALGGSGQRALRAAVDPESRLVAVPGRSGERLVIRLWDLETDTVDEVDFGEGGTTVWDWLVNLEFTPDGRLLAAVNQQLFIVDLDTGHRRVLTTGVEKFVLDRRGRVVLCGPLYGREPVPVSVHDLVSGTTTTLPDPGHPVSLALDPGGTIAVTGGGDGIIRVGPVSGGTRHWLVGDGSKVRSVAVSPDGRQIAAGCSDGTIRIWPMPDLNQPPLHELPRAELIARLNALTNLRVVRDPDDPDRTKLIELPFPGWRNATVW